MPCNPHRPLPAAPPAQCWGPENREAPLRLCATPGAPDACNAELKAFDATANPHLAAAALVGVLRSPLWG